MTNTMVCSPDQEVISFQILQSMLSSCGGLDFPLNHCYYGKLAIPHTYNKYLFQS